MTHAAPTPHWRCFVAVILTVASMPKSLPATNRGRTERVPAQPRAGLRNTHWAPV